MGNAHLDKSKCNLVKIEFLTQKEKQRKDQAIAEWYRQESLLNASQSDDDFSIVPNLEELYDVGFRQEVYIPLTMKSIDVGYIMQYLDQIDEQPGDRDGNCAYPKLAEFVKTEVKSYFLLMEGKQVSDRSITIDMSKCVVETPVFEFIYEKRPFFQFLAKKTAYVAKNWKRLLLKKTINFLGIAPILNAIKKIQAGDKTGVMSLMFSKQVFKLLGNYALGPNMVMGGVTMFIKFFFPLATPFLYFIQQN